MTLFSDYIIGAMKLYVTITHINPSDTVIIFKLVKLRRFINQNKSVKSVDIKFMYHKGQCIRLLLKFVFTVTPTYLRYLTHAQISCFAKEVIIAFGDNL